MPLKPREVNCPVHMLTLEALGSLLHINMLSVTPASSPVEPWKEFRQV